MYVLPFILFFDELLPLISPLRINTCSRDFSSARGVLQLWGLCPQPAHVTPQAAARHRTWTPWDIIIKIAVCYSVLSKGPESYREYGRPIADLSSALRWDCIPPWRTGPATC